MKLIKKILIQQNVGTKFCGYIFIAARGNNELTFNDDFNSLSLLCVLVCFRTTFGRKGSYKITPS